MLNDRAPRHERRAGGRTTARDTLADLLGRPSLPSARTAVLVFLAVLVPESLVLHYLGSTSPIWATNAIVVAVMLRSPTRIWPGLLAILLAADFSANTLFGDGIWFAVSGCTCDVFEVAVVASLLERVGRKAPLFSSLAQIGRFAAICLTVPMVSAAGGAAALQRLLGYPFVEVWPNWYLSEVFGFVIVAPFVLIWAERRHDANLRSRAWWEVVGLALLVGIVTAVDFSFNRGVGGYLCFPFLLFAAFRGGMLGATASAFALAVVASYLTLAGGAAPGATPVSRILLLQLYLAFVLLSTLPVAVMLEHRKLLNAAKAVAQLSRMVRHDVLTGLPNRLLLQERLDAMQASTQAAGGVVALLLIDLDRFKPVNDLHGHAAGDQLLQLVARRLQHTLRPDDTVARIGGDEFAALCLTDGVQAAETLAQTVIDALADQFHLADCAVQIGCSVGITVDPDGDLDADILSRRADAALYRAKTEGRNCYCLYQPELDIKIRERAELEVELRLAIAAGEIVPFFQPIVLLETSALVGFEMLARWPHRTLGDILPTTFIPIAEATGLIGRLTEQLLRRGCQVALTWPDDIFLAANVSPVQLRDRRLPAQIRAVLTETGLPAARLDIELTEGALIDDFALAREILIDLKSTGLKLTLDDFGTGYSSLRHLQDLPLDRIKIDLDFVSSMITNVASRKIVAGVVGLGHSLNLPVVAEGIGDTAAEAELKLMGCDMGQGWLYGRAMTPAQTTALVDPLRSRAVTVA